MSKVFPHSNRKGTEAALALVEETLASLRKRVERQQQHQHERESKVKDAATNTTPPPPPSMTSSKASKKPRNKSVLIKRKSKYKAKRTRNLNSLAHKNLEKHILKEEAEKAPQTHCSHCNTRIGGAESQTSGATQEKRKDMSRPSHNDPEPPPVREKVLWKHKKRGHGRWEESENDSKPSLVQERAIQTHRRGQSRREEPEDNLESPGVREKVIWRHSRREESEDSSQDSSCHMNVQKTYRQARPYSDPEPQPLREKFIWRHEKRGHSRREDSEDSSQDSSCHGNTRKTQMPTKACSRPKQTRYDFGGSKAGQQRREKEGAVNEVCKCSKQATQKEKRKSQSTCQKPPVDVWQQGYAQPTHTYRLKVDQSCPRKKVEKENIIPYIPCGSKSRSYHMGVIVQQEMGRLNSQPLQEHTHISSKSIGQHGYVAGVTEETVRRAMVNIHQHLTSCATHTDPDL